MFKAQQIEERIAEIRAEIRKFFEAHPARWDDHLRLTTHLAELQVALSERAELETRKITDLTRRLVRLTWGLVIVSVALLLFAIAQLAITFQQNGDAQAQQIKVSQQQLNTSTNH
jgi:hypothetical protein